MSILSFVNGVFCVYFADSAVQCSFIFDVFAHFDRLYTIDMARAIDGLNKMKQTFEFCIRTRVIFDVIVCYFIRFHAAPPEITVERSWVHASEGYDIELACIIHGDVTSDVSTKAE